VDDVKKIKGIIENARLCSIYDLFTRKPQGLKFNDTDAIVITVRTEDGNRITETFYFCLKADGTFDAKPINMGSGTLARRRKLVSFLEYYGIAENAKHYNITKNIDEWTGRTIEVVLNENERRIYIP
jgi:hypothetical protein